MEMSKVLQKLENTVDKGKIAHNEQFLLCPQYFQKTCTVDMLKDGLVWERIKWFSRIVMTGEHFYTDSSCKI